jgi:hypothetical protein
LVITTTREQVFVVDMSAANQRLQTTLVLVFVASVVLQLAALMIWVRIGPEGPALQLWAIPMMGFGYILWRHRLSLTSALLTGLIFWILIIPTTLWLGWALTGSDGP